MLASKIAARAVAVLVVVIGFGFAALLTVGSQLDQAETWWRFAAWIVATLLYATFWFAVAVLVNLRGRSSATNGTILAGIWLMLVVIGVILG